jgi:hypothetical protein
MTLPLISFEQERRWLASLGKLSKHYFIIGFDLAEESYLIERARDRLAQVNLKLNFEFQDEVQSTNRSESTQISFFETVNWLCRSYSTIDKIDHKKWPTHESWLIKASTIPSREHLSCADGSTILSALGEKPWQKSKRIESWLIAMGRSHGLTISPVQAQRICEQYSLNRQMIRSEVEKWSAFHNYEGLLQDSSVNELSDSFLHLSGINKVWKWQEAIFNANCSLALDRVEGLLIEDALGIGSAAFIRSQWQSLGLTLWGHLEGHSEPLEKARFNQSSVDWKVKKEQQKLQQAQKLGLDHWIEGMRVIASAQIALKDKRKPLEVLQILSLQLCQLIS